VIDVIKFAESPEQCIATIFDKDDNYLGMGFVISEEYLITCFHIINPNVLENTSSDFFLRFSLTKDESRYLACIDIAFEKEDITILKIKSKPINVLPCKLIMSPIEGDKFRTYGWLRKASGDQLEIWIEGNVAGRIHNQKMIQLVTKQSYRDFSQKGLSGSLVWSESYGGIIGMIAQIVEGKGLIKAISCEVINKTLEGKVPIHSDFYTSNLDILEKIMTSIPAEDIRSISFNNILLARKIMNALGLLCEHDYSRLSAISWAVSGEWNLVRDELGISQDSQYNLVYNFPAYDDTHSVLVEEKIYELLFNNLDYEGFDLSSYLRSLDNEIQDWAKKSEEAKIKEKGENLRTVLRLRNNDIFILLASAWLHDIGMNPIVANLLRCDEEKLNAEPRTKAKYLLENHHIISTEYINYKGHEFHLENSRDPLKRVCELHRHKNYSELYKEFKNYEINSRGYNIPLLAAYLRLAGALVISRKSDVPSYMAVGFGEPYSRFQWLKSQIATDSQVNRKKYEAIISIPKYIIGQTSGNLSKVKRDKEEKKFERHKIILKDLIKRELQNELDSTREIFIRNKVIFYLNAKCEEKNVSNFDFHADQLLSSIELFETSATPTTSAIIDIVLNQISSILNSEDFPINITNLMAYNNNVLCKIVFKYPFHVPLLRIKNYLDSILPHSIERSVCDKIIDRISTIISEREDIFDLISDISYSIIRNHSPTLLYGYSKCIINCLEDGFKKDSNVSKTPLYVCHVAGSTRYRYNNKLIFNDAIKYIEELSNMIDDIYYIPDMAALNLIKQRKISRILFGANGIDLDGNLYNGLGHLAIADWAARYHVPVYVVAETIKIGNIKYEKDLMKRNQWLTTDVDKEKTMLEHKRSNQHIISYNPRIEVVPFKLISAIITEKGIVSPQDVRSLWGPVFNEKIEDILCKNQRNDNT
jgi:translation initiation factor 2B subunit (eIF-2B alpha/beta/delta family)